MTTATLVNSELRLDLPSSFSDEERVVKKSAHERLSVPQIFLPTRVTASVTRGAVEIRMMYFLEEASTEHWISESKVKVQKGMNTQRILSVHADIDKPTFTTLLNRMADIGSALKAEVVRADSAVQKQNYKLILTLVNRTVAQISHARLDIEEKIFAKDKE